MRHVEFRRECALGEPRSLTQLDQLRSKPGVLRGVEGSYGAAHGVPAQRTCNAVRHHICGIDTAQMIPRLGPSFDSPPLTALFAHVTASFPLRSTLAFALLITASCKPAPTATKPVEDAPRNVPPQSVKRSYHRPTADELTGYLQGLLPPFLKAVGTNVELPSGMPAGTPDTTTWIVTVRLTCSPVEDLLGSPSPRNAQSFQETVSRLDGLVAWSEAYSRSSYASLHPGFEVNAPAPPSPRLVAVAHPKDRPLSPIYGKVAAEWQFDHWQYMLLDWNLPNDLGELRSQAKGPFLIEGEPETARFVAAAKAAVAESEPKKAEIERIYASQVVSAAHPGSFYRGQLAFGSSVFPADVRFLDRATPDPQYVQFEIRVPSRPDFLFAFSAKLSRTPPIQHSSKQQNTQTVWQQNSTDTEPKGDLTVSITRAAGKDDLSQSAIAKMLRAFKVEATSHELPLNILQHKLVGKVGSWYSEPIVLSAQQSQ